MSKSIDATLEIGKEQDFDRVASIDFDMESIDPRGSTNGS
jgi:hypothetical protein